MPAIIIASQSSVRSYLPTDDQRRRMKLKLLLVWMNLLVMQNTASPESSSSSSICAANTALAKARALVVPPASVTYGGDAEHADFWYTHEELLIQARQEWGQLHPSLYTLNDYYIQHYLTPEIQEAIQAKSMEKLRSSIQSTEQPGVYKIPLFQPNFVSTFLEELQHQEDSNIPMRRPNAMNRRGCILDQIGFESVLQDLADLILRPLALTFYPDRISVEDVASHYGFVVKYAPYADVELKAHADASTITINVCLEPSQDMSPLYFQQVRELWGQNIHSFDDNKTTFVTLDTPGMALLHLGQHTHGITNVTSTRSNMVVWLHGQGDYVRVAKYDDSEQSKNLEEFQKRFGWK
jgi:hypothetical protein